MACHGIRKFTGGERGCVLESGHLGFHFDEVAHWDDETTVINWAARNQASFRYEYNERDGLRHIGRIG